MRMLTLTKSRCLFNWMNFMVCIVRRTYCKLDESDKLTQLMFQSSQYKWNKMLGCSIVATHVTVGFASFKAIIISQRVSIKIKRFKVLLCMKIRRALDTNSPSERCDKSKQFKTSKSPTDISSVPSNWFWAICAKLYWDWFDIKQKIVW